MTARIISFLVILLVCNVSRAAGPEPLGYYDLDTLGMPQFVNVNYIDVSKISQISKFRSSAGHDYHDDAETCRSMKHYFIQPDATTSIVSPVAGTVTRLGNDFAGSQVQITSDLQPGFIFILFHVDLVKPLSVGEHIDEGQKLGTHIGTQTYSDIAVAVNTPKAYRLVSYFDTLTDAAFAAFQARGITSRSQLSFTKAERDADPYRCGGGEAFDGLRVNPMTEYVNLTGVQSITYPHLPYTLSLLDSPYPLAAVATSGLPVKMSTAGPCAVVDNKLILQSVGQCAVYFNQPGDSNYLPAVQLEYRITVTEIPPDVGLGSVFSGAQPLSQSFLRFINAGATTESVKVKVANGATGQSLGTWTSPQIPAGAAVQYSINTIESALDQTIAKPQFYTLAIETKMAGAMQHVLWRPSDGTLTNLSTCDTGATINRGQVANVHSSLLQVGYPSTVVVANTAVAEAAVLLGVFNSETGARLGTYTSPAIPGNGQVALAIPTIEAGAKISPGTTAYHYTIRAEGAFTGYLQHLVTNKQAGVTTDMTTVCPLRAVPQTTAATRVGSVYSTAQADLQSYLRIFNFGSVRDGRVTLSIADATTGKGLGQWTSPTIFTNVSQQFSIASIESAAGITGPKPATYVISMTSQLGLGYGFIQNVLWRPSDGTLTNISTCDEGVTAVPNRLISIHSKLLASDYPSTIALTNMSDAAKGMRLATFNAGTGVLYGRYVASDIPGRGMVHISSDTLEAAMPFILTTNSFHYNIFEESSFPGFLQHLVTNKRVGVITDMSTMCRIN